MKKNIKLLVAVILILTNYSIVYAHSGKTDSRECHYYRTNCARCGLNDGEYHCHNSENSSSTKHHQLYIWLY